MRRIILVLWLLGLASVAEADAPVGWPVDWRGVRFSSMTRTPEEFTVAEVVWYGLKGDSVYAKFRSEGKTWEAITMITSRLAWGERRLRRENCLGNPFDEGIIFQRTHHGKDWVFWHQLALVGALIEAGAGSDVLDPRIRAVVPGEGGFQDVLDPEVRRVLAEMKSAFEPHLEPHDPIWSIADPESKRDTHE